MTQDRCNVPFNVANRPYKCNVGPLACKGKSHKLLPNGVMQLLGLSPCLEECPEPLNISENEVNVNEAGDPVRLPQLLDSYILESLNGQGVSVMRL